MLTTLSGRIISPLFSPSLILSTTLGARDDLLLDREATFRSANLLNCLKCSVGSCLSCSVDILDDNGLAVVGDDDGGKSNNPRLVDEILGSSRSGAAPSLADPEDGPELMKCLLASLSQALGTSSASHSVSSSLPVLPAGLEASLPNPNPPSVTKSGLGKIGGNIGTVKTGVSSPLSLSRSSITVFRL